MTDAATPADTAATPADTAAAPGEAADLAPVVRRIVVHCSAAHAWKVFTDDMGAWWPVEGHSLDPRRLRRVTGAWQKGGVVGEEWDDGSFHRWFTVTVWEPPSRLVLSWNPGDRPADTEVEVTFREERPGLTRVVLEHRGWERLGEEATEVRRGYEDGWRKVLVPYQRAADDPEVHRTFGVTLNLTVWGELERTDRSPDDDQRMIDAAHASLWHWSRVGTAANLARGEWLCARAYLMVGRPEPAQHHARRCLEITEASALGDFDAFYAFEGMARALALAGHASEAAEWRRRAADALAAVADPEDREICQADLAAEPWFGLHP